MSISVHIFGTANIYVGPQDGSGQLLYLGLTHDGVRIRNEAYWDEIHTDERGGDAGPPVELSYLGERCVVTTELAKWDAQVADKIAARLWNNTAGHVPGAGIPVLAAELGFRLVIASVNPQITGWDFPRAVARDAIEINKGTRHSLMSIIWECYPNSSGVLYQSYNP